MAIAFVQVASHTVGPGTSATVNASADDPLAATTSGNLLVAHFTSTLTPGVLTMTGWTNLYDQTNTSTGTRDTWWLRIATGETTITGNSTLSDNLCLTVAEFSGMGNSPTLHMVGTKTEATTAATTLASPSITTTIAESLLLTGWAFEGGLPGTTNTYTNSFTALNTNQRSRAAYRIASATGAYTSTHTWSTARVAMASILALIPGTGGGGGGGGFYATCGPIVFG